MDERYLEESETNAPRKFSAGDRFFYVLGVIIAIGVAVTFQIARHVGFEAWMIIPGAAASFLTAIVLWWTDAFRYRPD